MKPRKSIIFGCFTIFIAFSVFLNYVGDRKRSDWEQRNGLPTQVKGDPSMKYESFQGRGLVKSTAANQTQVYRVKTTWSRNKRTPNPGGVNGNPFAQ